MIVIWKRYDGVGRVTAIHPQLGCKGSWQMWGGVEVRMPRGSCRGVGGAVRAAALCLVIGSCGSLGDPTDSKDPDVFEKIRSIDLLPRFPTQPPQGQVSAGTPAKAAIYTGSVEEAPLAAASAGGAAGTDRFDLNFENTPVASLAKVVLGDILGVGYVIDPRVQGTVSVSSGRPIPKSDALYVLENALRLNGVALIRDGTGYRLVPQADAAGQGAADQADRMTAGFGLTIVPLQYVSASTVLKLLDSFGTKAGAARADSARNLLLIQGTGSERRDAVDLVLSFDADFMRGQSVGIFPVQNSSPGPIIAELEKILDSGEGGMTQNVVKLQPIARQNAVLAVTRKPELLRRVELWIRRLDTAGGTRSAVHVYRVKYGDARQMARMLTDVFGGGGGAASSSGAFDTASNQIAPGSGMSASSSGSPSALSRLSAAPTPAAGLSAGNSRGGTGAGDLAGGGASAPAGSDFDSAAAGASGARGAGPPSVLEGVRITADTVNNSLLIFAGPEQYRLIQQTLREIDQPQLQVAVDATIAEVSLTDELQYGVQTYLTSRDVGLRPDKGSAGFAGPTAVVSQLGSLALQRSIPGFNFLGGSSASPTVILNALHAVTDVKVLSNPSLVVIDNQVATFQVGDEIPIQTGSATVLTGNNTVATTTDYKMTGIILRVMPRIFANGNVRLDIEQEISNPVNNPTTSSNGQGGNSLTPTVSTRKVRSSVAVANGQTVLLAGLISDSQNKNRSAIPIIDQIPVVGEFASGLTNKQVKRTELIIFIRPQIIRDGSDAHFVAEELRTKLRGSIGANAAPSITPVYR